MSTQPTITFQSASAPYAVFNTFTYIQTKDYGGASLPVLNGENSDPITFRIYNNYSLSSGIATAMNVAITVYDGVGSGSHTASQLPASQNWLRVMQNGFGESVGTPGLFTAYAGSDVAVGGTNKYTLQKGSDGTLTPIIRAGTGGAGVGFAQIKSYLQLPASVPPGNYNFCLTVEYDWTS